MNIFELIGQILQTAIDTSLGETKKELDAQGESLKKMQDDALKMSQKASGSQKSAASPGTPLKPKGNPPEKTAGKVKESMPQKMVLTEAARESVRVKVQRFRMDMMKYLPFYGDVVVKMTIREDMTIPTAATNGREIKYNPAFFHKRPQPEVNYILLHEVLHVILLHWKRQSDRDQQLWNIACDFVVNETIDWIISRDFNGKVPLKRPEVGCFHGSYYQGFPAEEFYQRLLKKSKIKHDICIYEDRLINGRPEDLLPGELPEAEAKLVEDMLKRTVRDAIKRRGTGESRFIPGELFTLVETRVLPWRKLLIDFLTEKEDEESSYRTPERKYIHMDLIVPGIGKKDDELGEVWAFVDSSGSISQEDMNQFMTQLYRIVKEFHSTLNIAFWDTEVTDVYKQIDSVKKIMDCISNHSGGTDINCVYRYIREQKIKPEVMLILTDGYYGELTEPVGNLKKKTILVITENGCRIEKNNPAGKLARL